MDCWNAKFDFFVKVNINNHNNNNNLILFYNNDNFFLFLIILLYFLFSFFSLIYIKFTLLNKVNNYNYFISNAK